MFSRMTPIYLRQKIALALATTGCLAVVGLSSAGPATASTLEVGKPVSNAADSHTGALTGTYRIATATVNYDGTTYTLDAQRSALLITNGYDGGQTANLDGVASHKGVAVPLVVIHSTGGAFPHGVEESAPAAIEIGSAGTPREEGVGTIQLRRTGTMLDYRSTVPTASGTHVTIDATAVLESPRSAGN